MNFGRRPGRWWRLGGKADPMPEGQHGWSMDLGRRTGIALSAAMFRVRVTGLNRVPATGPVLFVANHTAFVDGVVLFGLLPRRTSFLIKAEAVTGPVGALLRHVGQFAIDREVPSRDVLLAAQSQLAGGGAVGVFPEGTRGDGLVRQVLPGAGWLAARSGATVVPVAVRGTARPAGARRRFRPVVRVRIGEPYQVAKGAGKSAVGAATATIQQRLSELVRGLDDDLAGVVGRPAGHGAASGDHE